jgi:hypothetical protein
MSDTNIVANYLMSMTKLRDQLDTLGGNIEDEELAPITLKVFSPYWNPFV